MKKKLFAGATTAIDSMNGEKVWIPYAFTAIDKDHAMRMGIESGKKDFPSPRYGGWVCGLVEVPSWMIAKTL